MYIISNFLFFPPPPQIFVVDFCWFFCFEFELILQCIIIPKMMSCKAEVVRGAGKLFNTFFLLQYSYWGKFFFEKLWFQIKLCSYIEVKSSIPSLPFIPLSFTSLSANLPSILYLPLLCVPLPYLPYLPLTFPFYFPSLSLP